MANAISVTINILVFMKLQTLNYEFKLTVDFELCNSIANSKFKIHNSKGGARNPCDWEIYSVLCDSKNGFCMNGKPTASTIGGSEQS